MDVVLDRMAGQDHPNRTTIELDRRFHTTVAAMLDNAVLVRVVGELFDQRMNPYFERLSSYFEDRETWQAALEEHRAVRDAIAAGDPAAARAAMREHLERSQSRFAQEGFGRAAAAGGRRRKEATSSHTG